MHKTLLWLSCHAESATLSRSCQRAILAPWSAQERRHGRGWLPGRSAASGSTFVYGTMNEAAKNARPSGTIWTTGIATPKAASTKRMMAIIRAGRAATLLLR